MTRKSNKRRFPPLPVWIVVGVLTVAVVWLRVSGIVGDNAMVNVFTLLLCFSAAVVLGRWFVFRSSYPRRARIGVLLAGLAAPLLLLAIYRVEHVSGELIPEFRLRWAPRPDQLLSKPDLDPTTGPADLTAVSSRDFPQFLGPERNARVDAGLVLATDWKAKPPRLLWKQPIGAGWSAFAAVNGFAVTMEQRGSEELVTCYEIATGRLVWSYGTQTRHSTVLGGVGPRSTPCIEDGRVYSLGATGTVLCLEGGTGELVWQDDLLTRYGLTPSEDQQNVSWGRSGSPLVVDDLLVVPAGGPAEGTRHSLIAYHKRTGAVAWQSGDRQVGYSSPAVATVAGISQILSINEDTVSGHDPQSGDVLWEHPWPGESTGPANTSQPAVVDSERILVSKGYGGGAMMLRLSQPTENGDLIVDELWRNKRVLKTKFTNVVVHDGYLYGLSDGILECVDAADGSRQWKRGRYYHGQLLGVGNLLLVQQESGSIALVEASPAGWNELSQYPAMDGKTWNNPCLHGSYLLVRNADEACCYELPIE